MSVIFVLPKKIKQGCKVAKLQNYKVAKLQSCKVCEVCKKN